MFRPNSRSSERSRELRRRVVLPARLNTGEAWRNAYILNISSRGLLIRAGPSIVEGSCVEVRRGDHVITARVIWRDGSHAGLQSDERVPVEEIMSTSSACALQLVASDGAAVDRRDGRREKSVDSRAFGRLIQFIGLALIAGAFAIAIWVMAQHAFSAPLARVEAALGN